MNNKIDYVIVGGQKCGTTSIHMSLSKHQNIYAPYGFKDKKLLNSDLTINHNLFKTQGKKILGSNVNYCVDIKALENIKKHNPEVEIIYVTRNPIHRITSAYRYAIERGLTTKTLNEIINEEILSENFNQDKFLTNQLSFISQSKYGNILENLTKIFNTNKIHLCEFELLKSNPNKFYNELISCLNIENQELESIKTNITKGKYKFKFINDLLFKKSKSFKFARKNLRLFIPKNLYKQIRDKLREFNKIEDNYVLLERDKKFILSLLEDDLNKFKKLITSSDYNLIGFNSIKNNE